MNSKTVREGIPSASGLVRFKGDRLVILLGVFLFSYHVMQLLSLLHSEATPCRLPGFPF
jgi:hypothetical protein